MGLNKLLADLSIISKLGTNPGVDNGLSDEQLKTKFDEAANIIKDYLNNYLVPELEKTVDVEALLSDILDTTLSKEDKAANALTTGDTIRGLRSFFEKAVHSGDYVLESDSSFAAYISGSAMIRVMGGEGVMQGNLFALNVGAYEDVKLLDGVYGLCRNDLIVVRCTKKEGVLSYALAGLTGTSTSGEPADPEYTQSDINADGTVRDFPLYRVKFDGVDIVSIEALFTAEKPIVQNIKEYVDAKHFEATATLSADAWEEGESYTQTIAVDGILSTDNPRIDPVLSSDKATRTAQLEAMALVSYGETTDGAITFACDDGLPEIDIPIHIEVHR